MEITWYGQSCFRLRQRGQAVVTDPYRPDIGLRLPRLSANIVTISHAHPDHDMAEAIRGEPFVIHGPGEYEVDGIFVIGAATFHDARQGQEQGKNTAYLIEFDDLKVCHLGDLGHVLTQEQVEQLGSIDVLLVPVGGRTVLTAARAAEVVNMLEPRIVVPMHYKIPGLNLSCDGPNRFLKEMAIQKPESLETLNVSASQLGDETRVILLEPKQ